MGRKSSNDLLTKNHFDPSPALSRSPANLLGCPQNLGQPGFCIMEISVSIIRKSAYLIPRRKRHNIFALVNNVLPSLFFQKASHTMDYEIFMVKRRVKA